MPVKLHRKLKKQVPKSWPKKRQDAYVYGTMQKIAKAAGKLRGTNGRAKVMANG